MISDGNRFVAEVLTDSQGNWSLPKDPGRTANTRYDIRILDEHSCVLNWT